MMISKFSFLLAGKASALQRQHLSSVLFLIGRSALNSFNPIIFHSFTLHFWILIVSLMASCFKVSWLFDTNGPLRKSLFHSIGAIISYPILRRSNLRHKITLVIFFFFFFFFFTFSSASASITKAATLPRVSNILLYIVRSSLFTHKMILQQVMVLVENPFTVSLSKTKISATLTKKLGIFWLLDTIN